MIEFIEFFVFISSYNCYGLYKFEIENDLIHLLQFGKIHGMPGSKSFNSIFFKYQAANTPGKNHTN